MIQLQTYIGETALPYIHDLARLRITVFRSYPYLYEGTMRYEQQYLATLFAAAKSVLVLARSNDQIVGASTAIPLANESPNVQAPFLAQQYDVSQWFYYSESVLLPQYRGHGVGVGFFEARQKAALELGNYQYACFCAVIRPDQHPLRPADYVPLDSFWQKRGFQKNPALICTMTWQDLDETAESPKQLQFWTKQIRPNATL